MVKRILVGGDGSPGSDRALRRAERQDRPPWRGSPRPVVIVPPEAA